MTEGKKWYKSMTIRLALIQAAAGLLAVFASEYPEIGYLATVKSAIDIFLRYLTEKPID